MSTGPRFTELLDWVEGRLAPDQAARVAALVAADHGGAAERVEWIREFLAGARAMPLATPPADLSARLRSAFTGLQPPASGEEWSEAVLLHDSRSAAAGLRSLGEGLSLSFDSAIGRFVLEVTPSVPGEVDLSGLVLTGAGGDGVDVSFLEDGALCRAARADREGRFEVAGVPTTVDEMWLRADGTRVRAALDLTAR